MKRLLIVFGDYRSRNLAQKMQQALGDVAHIEEAAFDDVTFDLSPTSSRIAFATNDIAAYDLVYFRAIKNHKPLYEAVKARYPDLPTLQTLITPNYSSKLRQYAVFAREGMPFPHVYYSAVRDDEKYATQLQSVFPYPFVLKPLRGSKGRNVYRVTNYDESMTVLRTARADNVPMMGQEYIPNACDYRVLVVDNEVKRVLRRVRKKDEWRNNVSLGATFEAVAIADADPALLDIAVRGKQALGWRFAGMDIVQNDQTGEYLIFEGNNSPALSKGQKKILAQLARELLQNSDS